MLISCNRSHFGNIFFRFFSKNLFDIIVIITDSLGIFFYYSDVTEESIHMWADLPDEIRMDPSLSSFRQEYERIHGMMI